MTPNNLDQFSPIKWEGAKTVKPYSRVELEDQDRKARAAVAANGGTEAARAVIQLYRENLVLRQHLSEALSVHGGDVRFGPDEEEHSWCAPARAALAQGQI